MEWIEHGSVTTPSCFQASGIACGLKRDGAADMAMIYSPRPCVVAGAFTSNLFAAAPVEYDREIVSSGNPVHLVVVNSGNANACTGEQGLRDAERTAELAGSMMMVHKSQVLVVNWADWGSMPMDIIEAGSGCASKPCLRGWIGCIKGDHDDGYGAEERCRGAGSRRSDDSSQGMTKGAG